MAQFSNFIGGGAQYIDMGRELYRSEPRFREEMDRCFHLIREYMGKDLKALLYPPGERHGEEGAVNRIENILPLLFSFEYALARLLMQWGVKPAAMIGHSLGEYTAACLAGVFSLEQGLKLVISRGRLMQRCPGGGMLTVPMAEEDLLPLLDERFSLALVNSPTNCVVSGSSGDIQDLNRRLAADGYEGKVLHLSHAAHSHLLEPIRDEFMEILKTVDFERPGIPYISNLTGDWVKGDEVTEPSYWVGHQHRTVRYSAGIRTLLDDEQRTAKGVFVEVGPGRVLTSLLEQNTAGNSRPPGINLVRHPRDETPDMHYLLEGIGKLWCAGVHIDWVAFRGKEKPRRVPLPLYPFEPRRFPVRSSPAAPLPAAQPAPPSTTGSGAGPCTGISTGTGHGRETVPLDGQPGTSPRARSTGQPRPAGGHRQIVVRRRKHRLAVLP